MTAKPFAERSQKPCPRRTIRRLAAARAVDAEALHVLYSAFRDLDEKRNIPATGSALPEFPRFHGGLPR